MELDRFWSLVALVGYPPADEKGAFEPFRQALSELGTSQVVAFADILADQLHRLDLRRLAAVPTANRGLEQSTDGFLYNRCAVVLAGPEAVAAVLADTASFRPFTDSRMPSSEGLLYVAEEAYERVTGREWEHRTPLSYETGANSAGWR